MVRPADGIDLGLWDVPTSALLIPVDTHIHRLAARWGLSSGKNVVETERDLKRLFPEETWGRTHLEIIYFGREYCPALYHDLDACPICSWAASKKRKPCSTSRCRSRA